MIFFLLVIFLLFVKFVWPNIESRQNIAKYLEDIFCLPQSEIQEAVKDSEQVSENSSVDDSTEDAEEGEVEDTEDTDTEELEEVQDLVKAEEQQVQEEVQEVKELQDVVNAEEQEEKEEVKEILDELVNDVSENILEKKNN
jgi:hypothetical protein